MRTIAAFLIAPVLPLLLLASFFLLIGNPATGQDMKGGVTIAYLDSVVLGLPALGLVKFLRWNAPYHFAGLGVLLGTMTHWILWELLPVVAAYRDGRYNADQVLTAIFFLDYPKVAVEFAVLGALSGLVFWLIVRPDKRSNSPLRRPL